MLAARDLIGLSRKLSRSVALSFCLLITGASLGAVRGDNSTVFGQETQSEAALIGVLYDLKQRQDHEPTDVDPNDYTDIVHEFLSKDWDEAVLNRYYRVSKPLYTTQIFIPNMDADEAPKAFGAEKMVEPSRWIIHYKGQVSPPSAGTYRFWGIADDAMAVAVNGKTVLIACRLDMKMNELTWKPSGRDGAQAADGLLRPGDWMDLKEGEIIDLDVIIGERPGGSFNAFLMVEKRGTAYEHDARGNPILPIFQVGAYDTPVINNLKEEPLFAKGFPPWKSYQ
jgi:hypothetical protein